MYCSYVLTLFIELDVTRTQLKKVERELQVERVRSERLREENEGLKVML